MLGFTIRTYLVLVGMCFAPLLRIHFTAFRTMGKAQTALRGPCEADLRGIFSEGLYITLRLVPSLQLALLQGYDFCAGERGRRGFWRRS